MFNHSFHHFLAQPTDIAYSFKVRPAKDFGNPLNFSMYSVHLVPLDPSHGCAPANNLDDLEGEADHRQ